MKKSYESGLATHIGPESCGAARKGGVEALTGERAGRVFSRVRNSLRDAEVVRSALSSNGYLHFVLDLWFEKKVRRRFQEEAYLVRFADDFVVSFQYKRDAEKFDRYLRNRFARFYLALADDKTLMFLFGLFAADRKAKYDERPEAFDFLGFTHVCGTDRRGKFAVVRLPSRKSCRKFLARTKEWLSDHRHWKRRDQQRQLTTMLRGFFQYFGLHHLKRRLDSERHEVLLPWIRVLRR